ncbi:MAG: ABC transporter substrate-binding protein, partial [Cohnella sp.]|nr:ABC transporter substrate-binding protein [Cohnella sp.]
LDEQLIACKRGRIVYDGNGKADTYGMVLYQNIGWDYQGGAYWSSAWYHKDADNNFIPGMIGPGRKELIQTMADVYAQGAINKDFAIVTADQAYKEFYSGKAGMFLGTPKGMSEPDYLALLKVNPQAVVVPVPYFVAPDGKQGAATGPGFYGMTTLSGKLKGQTEKIDRIFEIMNFGRKWIPVDQRTPQNKDFDWLFGHEGTGYDMVNGLPVLRKGAEKDTPFQYMLQRHENYNPWAPSDNDNQYSKTQYSSPEMQQFIAKIEKMERESNKTPYADPSRGVFSETNAKKGAELNTYLINEQTKMISGNRPVADWDKLVKEWKDRGGADVIKEVNAGIKERQSNK